MSTVIEQRIAGLLANFGLLVFFALAAACWMPWSGLAVGRAQFALVTYAALVLSFLGGVQWGLVLAYPGLNKREARHALGGGIVPLILGWLAALLLLLGLAPWIVFALLIADFGFAWLIDVALYTQYPDLPGWYRAVRRRVVSGAMLALLIALLASVS